MRARCKRAPFPLYTGKPAPVILLPSSKSIRSYFLANSQWGIASSDRTGIFPARSVSILSSSEIPLVTSS